MRVLGSVGAGLLLMVLMAAGCGENKQVASNTNTAKGNSNAALNPRANTPPDNVRRVTVTELRDMLEQDKAVVVDVRGTSAYEQERIKGSIDIPEQELTARAGELPKDKLIVFYCS